MENKNATYESLKITEVKLTLYWKVSSVVAITIPVLDLIFADFKFFVLTVFWFLIKAVVGYFTVKGYKFAHMIWAALEGIFCFALFVLILFIFAESLYVLFAFPIIGLLISFWIIEGLNNRRVRVYFNMKRKIDKGHPMEALINQIGNDTN